MINWAYAYYEDGPSDNTDIVWAILLVRYFIGLYKHPN